MCGSGYGSLRLPRTRKVGWRGYCCQQGGFVPGIELPTPCTFAWHAVQSVIRFGSESSPASTQFLMVNLQIRHCAATLTPPAVSAQHLLPQGFVQLGNQPQAWILWWNAVHDAFSVICSTNACRCSPGRNLKNQETECKHRDTRPAE